jgi:hypothetical protein
MLFVLIALLFMYVGRKLGWMLSRAVLYSAPTGVVVSLSIGWGVLVAFAIRELLNWQQPGLVLRWLFGYWCGGYVAVPDFGLFSPPTMPQEAQSRHHVIVSASSIAFIAVSVALAYAMPYPSAP